MEQIDIKLDIKFARLDELHDGDRALVEEALKATARSYAPYSHFNVGAALRLEDGTLVVGANQENAAFPVTICAERTALFAAHVNHPNTPVVSLAIAARDASGNVVADPVTPCGSCRQVMLETEMRFKRPIHLLLYGTKGVYVIDGVKNIMPLSFEEF